MNWDSLANVAFALGCAPFLMGVINRTKAIFAGRQGQPLLQTYYEIWRLLHKGAVYSKTTSWFFRAGPLAGLAITVLVLFLIPFGRVPAVVSFQGDFIFVVYLLGLMRMMTVLAALDTGSSFEGMGASRELQFSAIAEVALVFALSTLAWKAGTLSISEIFTKVTPDLWRTEGGILSLLGVAILLVFLAENARVPIDDPNTHLELTMIHEVMVLDHSGPDFAMILYSSALKLWILGTFLLEVLLPFQVGNFWLDHASFIFAMFALAVLVGIIESSMARLRLIFVPRFLMGAVIFALLAFLLGLR